MNQIIIFVLQLTFGISAAVLGRFVVEGDTGTVLASLGLSVIILATVLFVVEIIRKNKGLSAKDKTQKVGKIEEKAAKRALARQRGGYLTLKLFVYFLLVALVTCFFAGMEYNIIEIIGGVLALLGIIFCGSYVYFQRKEEE